MSNDARRALVTGASGGIGKAIAEHLLARGWRVHGLDVAMPTIEHAAFESARVDLADRGAVAAAAANLRHVDALVHAAGVLKVGALGQLDHDAGALMWRLHVESASILADAIVPAMAQRRFGRVIFIGSRVAQGMTGRAQYAASKAALVALARSWAAELAAHHVTVNVISPAATQTAMLADPARAAESPRVPPIGRFIRPEEIAALTAFLFSPEAAAITGQDIAICGGASLPK